MDVMRKLAAANKEFQDRPKNAQWVNTPFLRYSAGTAPSMTYTANALGLNTAGSM